MQRIGQTGGQKLLWLAYEKFSSKIEWQNVCGRGKERERGGECLWVAGVTAMAATKYATFAC